MVAACRATSLPSAVAAHSSHPPQSATGEEVNPVAGRAPERKQAIIQQAGALRRRFGMLLQPARENLK